MRAWRPVTLCLVVAAVLAAAGPAVAQTDRQLLDEIGVVEHQGALLPKDLTFVDDQGRTVRLGDYFDGERPVALTFVFHNCPMLCSLVLDGLTMAMRETDLELGRQYQVLAVSFDPEDTPERAAEAKQTYVARLQDPEAAEAYHFLTGSEESIARLTEAAGFEYAWSERRQEFVHTATLLFLSPAGRITRYLYGIEFPRQDFRLSLLEAAEGKIGSPVDQLFLYCFVFDPEAGTFVASAMRIMQVGGTISALLLGLFLLIFWRLERSRRAKEEEESPSWPPAVDPAGTPL